MARQGGRIEPNLELKRYGLGDGYITITGSGVSITLMAGDASDSDRENPLQEGHWEMNLPIIMLDPESAPLFRMVANRLDELAGKLVKK